MFCGAQRVGSIDGVFAEGTSDVAEYLVVRWDARGGTPVLIATKDVQTIEERGVTLMSDDTGAYVTAPRYDDKHYPTLRRIR